MKRINFGVVVASVIVIGGAIVSPIFSVVASTDDSVIQQSSLSVESNLEEAGDEEFVPSQEEVKQQQAVGSSIANEFTDSVNPVNGYKKTPEARMATKLIASLILKYGRVYVMKTLPKIVYKKISKYLAKKVTQATFVRVWGNVANFATGSAISGYLYKVLRSYGVSKTWAGIPSGAVNFALSALL